MTVVCLFVSGRCVSGGGICQRSHSSHVTAQARHHPAQMSGVLRVGQVSVCVFYPPQMLSSSKPMSLTCQVIETVQMVRTVNVWGMNSNIK